MVSHGNNATLRCFCRRSTHRLLKNTVMLLQRLQSDFGSPHVFRASVPEWFARISRAFHSTHQQWVIFYRAVFPWLWAVSQALCKDESIQKIKDSSVQVPALIFFVTCSSFGGKLFAMGCIFPQHAFLVAAEISSCCRWQTAKACIFLLKRLFNHWSQGLGSCAFNCPPKQCIFDVGDKCCEMLVQQGKEMASNNEKLRLWRYSIECPHLSIPWVVGVDFTFYVYATIDFFTELCFPGNSTSG